MLEKKTRTPKVLCEAQILINYCNFRNCISSLHLAVETLQKLAEDYKIICPITATIVENYFYVDDLLYEANSAEIIYKKKKILHL